ncbi:hypothetical protein CJP74_02470 [Psittacicella melopsittaci]|uniref:5'-nucleotidase, lipoprotein e(P4) family n=2 Tax=Psittacicella melopsittaci TaxID=2028576 RepID=A0A3A1Y7V5_9GAMM|nr:hypothetical protein CJP74_02470 [Psittacicella melopsittaci]
MQGALFILIKMTREQAFTAALILLICLGEDEVSQIEIDVNFYSAEQIFGQQLVGALIWQQQSAEYQAVCYQIFNQAKSALKQLEVGSILIDIDETLLDNSLFEAGLSVHGLGYKQEYWDYWETHGTPGLVPGALDFVLTAHKQGFKIYYVSNRYGGNLQATIDILQKLGFPEVNKHTVLLQYTYDYAQTKQERIARVCQREKVVMYVGDMIDDFYTGQEYTTNAQRKEWVAEHKQELGCKYIILPNPVYGNWMTLLTPDFYGNKLSEQNKIAVATLLAWELSNYAQFFYDKKQRPTN